MGDILIRTVSLPCLLTPRGVQGFARGTVSDSAIAEFLAIVQRDLSATSVRVEEVGHDGGDPQTPGPAGHAGGDPQTPGPAGHAGEDPQTPGPAGHAGGDLQTPGPAGHAAGASPAAAEASLQSDLPGGRRLVVTFAVTPLDIEARRRRLEMLVGAFTDILDADGPARTPRPPPASSLQEELAALAQRAGALEVVIIDAHSPVVWGSVGSLEDHAARIAALLPTLRARAPLHAVDADDLADAAHYGLASAQGLRIDPSARSLVPHAVAAHHQLLPISRTGDRLVVAMADPRDADAIHDLILVTGLDIEPVYAGDAMAPFLRHLDGEGDARTYEESMAAVSAEDRASREPRARAARDTWARTVVSRRAIAEVRELPETEGLHKGAQLRHTVTDSDFGYVARSFSSIYIVIVIFGAAFDELLAKRALAHAMPTIERLVAALPPLDPPPRIGGVAAMRAPRRRR